MRSASNLSDSPSLSPLQSSSSPCDACDLAVAAQTTATSWCAIKGKNAECRQAVPCWQKDPEDLRTCFLPPYVLAGGLSTLLISGANEVPVHALLRPVPWRRLPADRGCDPLSCASQWLAGALQACNRLSELWSAPPDCLGVLRQHSWAGERRAACIRHSSASTGRGLASLKVPGLFFVYIASSAGCQGMVSLRDLCLPALGSLQSQACQCCCQSGLSMPQQASHLQGGERLNDMNTVSETCWIHVYTGCPCFCRCSTE